MLHRHMIIMFLRSRVQLPVLEAAQERMATIVDSEGMFPTLKLEYVIGDPKLAKELRDMYRQREAEEPTFLAALF